MFIPEWLSIPERDRLRLGKGRLGEAAVGKRILQGSTRFRIILGPLDLQSYETFLPIGERSKALEAIICNWTGKTLAWEVNLVLEKDQVPEPRLGSICRLGWTFWLFSKTPKQDPNDFKLLRKA